MGVEVLPKGRSYLELPETRIIVICDFDLSGDGYTRYTELRIIKETGKVVDKKTQVLYLSTRYTICNIEEDIKLFLDYIRYDGVDYLTKFTVGVVEVFNDVKASLEERRRFMMWQEHDAEQCQIDNREGQDELACALINDGLLTEKDIGAVLRKLGGF